MGFALKLDLPISATVCDSCIATDKMQQISEGNLNLIVGFLFLAGITTCLIAISL